MHKKMNSMIEIENPGHMINKQYGRSLRVVNVDKGRVLIFTNWTQRLDYVDEASLIFSITQWHKRRNLAALKKRIKMLKKRKVNIFIFDYYTRLWIIVENIVSKYTFTYYTLYYIMYHIAALDFYLYLYSNYNLIKK